MTEPVFLCVPMETIGGAEKRFAGLACAMHRRGDTRVKLVIQESLADMIRSLPELQPIPPGLIETFHVDRRGLFSAIRRKLRQLHASNPKAVFHLVTVSPAQVQRFLSRRVLFSEACSSLTLLNWKGRLLSYSGAAFAARTDVLESTVGDAYRRAIPVVSDRISVTPNSFVDLNFYKTAATKRNRLTFVGLFAERKQAYRLARCVPAIDAALRAAGVEDPEFFFLGRDSGEGSMASILASFDKRIRVTARFDPNPAATLAESKVVFSVQRVENYPSKALLEGMACGALPIVTDVGGSRRIAKPEFSEFVRGEFSPDEVASAAVRIMTLSEEQRLSKVALMHSFLEVSFSIEPMVRYYQAIYDELTKR